MRQRTFSFFGPDKAARPARRVLAATGAPIPAAPGGGLPSGGGFLAGEGFPAGGAFPTGGGLPAGGGRSPGGGPSTGGLSPDSGLASGVGRDPAGRVLLLGSRASAKAERLIDGEVSALLVAGRGSEVLYVVRDEPRRRRLRRRAIEGVPGRGAFDLPFVTADRLVRDLHARLPGRRRVVSEVERRILVEGLIAPAPSHEGRPGLVERYARVLAELRAAGFVGVDLPGGRPVDRDLARLLGRYADALAARGLTDPEGASAAVAEALDRHEPALAAVRGEVLVFDGLHELPPVLKRILAALAARFHRVRVLLDAEADLPLGSAAVLADAAAFYERTLACLREAAEPGRATLGRELAARLFVRDATPPLPPGEAPSPPPGGLQPAAPAAAREGARGGERVGVRGLQVAAKTPFDLSLRRYDTPLAEVEGIARSIRELVEREPAPARRLDRIGVIFPTVEGHAEIVRDVFPRFGVPFELERGFALASSPLVRAALELISAAASGLARADLARALFSPHVRFRSARPGNPVLRFGAIDRVAREAGLERPAGGRAGWRDGLARYAERARARLADLERLASPEGPGERAERYRLERGLRAVERDGALLDEALGALEEAVRPGAALDPRELETAVLGLIGRFEIAEQALSTRALKTDPAAAARDAAAYRAFGDLLRDVARALDRPIEIGRYLAVLRIAVLGEMTLPAASATGPGRVRVLGLRDARGVPFDHVFLAGLTEDALPGRRAADLFYGDAERRALGLPTEAERVKEMRYLFADALAAPERSLALSFAGEEEDEDGARSPFLDELERVAPEGLLPPKPPAEAEGRRLYAPHERQAWLGRALPKPLLEAEASEAEATLVLAASGAPARALLRAVAVAGEREDPSALGPHEGLLDAAAAITVASPLLREGRRLSPTLLDRYATCPFRAFAETVVRLAPLRDPDEDETARFAGDLAHRALARFYGRGFRRKRGEAWVATASARLRAIVLEEAAREARDADPFWRARVKALLAGLAGETTEAPGPLRLFLEREAVRPDDLEPHLLEVPVEAAIDAGGIPLAIGGIVDRIDLRGHDFVAVDYKTGAAPALKEVEQGLRLQLPIYLVAAQETLGVGFRPVGAAYEKVLANPRKAGRSYFADAAALEKGGALGKSQQLYGKVPSLAEALANVAPAVRRIVNGIRWGSFHPGHLPPEVKGCQHCDFRRVCRVDHDRVARLAEEGAPRVFTPLPLVPPRKAASP